MKNHLITSITFAIFLFFDFITKNMVESKIALGERINILGSFVQFTLIYNRGGVFGIFQGYQIVFLIISLIVFIFLLFFYYHEKNKSIPFCLAMGLIFSGAAGNILDRLLGKEGVVDFIYIGVDKIYRWPAFNIADAAIVVGAILLVFIFYTHEKQLKQS